MYYLLSNNFVGEAAAPCPLPPGSRAYRHVYRSYVGVQLWLFRLE